MSKKDIRTSVSLLPVEDAGNREDPVELHTSLRNAQSTPKWRRGITGLASFTFSTGAASLCLHTVTVYIASQVPAIEKALNIDSTTSGVLMSCNDIGFLTTILFSSHLLRKSHIPRVLGVCTAVYGCASFLCSIPHFVDPAVLPWTSELRNISSELLHLCTRQGREVRGTMSCDVDGRRPSKSWSVGLFAVCLLIQGAVKAPRTPLVTEYIDNNVIQKRHTGVLLGSVLTLGVFGLAIAFVLGGIFSAIPVDLSDTALTRRDPRWIGAWWLGFLVLGVTSVVLAVPLFFYPKQQTSRPLVPTEEHPYPTTEELSHQTEEQTFLTKVKDVPKSVFRVVRNPVYLLTLLAMAGLNMRAISLLVFGSKYMEHVFSVPIWQSSMFIGIGVMLLSGVGCFLGGAVVSHFKMGRRGCLLFATGAMVLSTVSEGINMRMGCPNTRIAGLNLELNGTLNTTACQCDGTDFLPVCGNDVTFFSPCHAGCQNSTGISYGGCSGVEGGAVVLGMCDTDCFKLYPFMALTVVYAVVGSFSIVPSYLVLIRSVSERDRTMAASIYGLAISLLAYIPGPVLYGKIIDTTCIVWRNLCGKRGACALYDIVEWRMKMAGTNVGLLVMSTLFAVLAYCVLTYKGRPAVAKSV